jgi:hypothetical protein
VRELGDEEDALTAPNLAFLAHALPAIPILLLGFLALEGRELVGALRSERGSEYISGRYPLPAGTSPVDTVQQSILHAD